MFQSICDYCRWHHDLAIMTLHCDGMRENRASSLKLCNYILDRRKLCTSTIEASTQCLSPIDFYEARGTLSPIRASCWVGSVKAAHCYRAQKNSRYHQVFDIDGPACPRSVIQLEESMPMPDPKTQKNSRLKVSTPDLQYRLLLYLLSRLLDWSTTAQSSSSARSPWNRSKRGPLFEVLVMLLFVMLSTLNWRKCSKSMLGSDVRIFCN